MLVDTGGSLIFGAFGDGRSAEEGRSLSRGNGKEKSCDEIRGQHCLIERVRNREGEIDGRKQEQSESAAEHFKSEMRIPSWSRDFLAKRSRKTVLGNL